MHSDLLFVYGTLRRACPAGAHQKFLTGAGFVAHARVPGKLYRVSYYPALVMEENPQESDWVTGEIYRLIGPEQLHALDLYEECTYPALPGQEYQRIRGEVITDSGEKVIAWIYAYRRPIANLPLIVSGDFLNP